MARSGYREHPRLRVGLSQSGSHSSGGELSVHQADTCPAASQLISRNSMRKEKALWTRREGGSKAVLAIVDDHDAEGAAHNGKDRRTAICRAGVR